MLNKQLIEKYFRVYINTTFLHKPDVHRFLLNHPRKEVFFSNMLKEIRQIELQPLKFGVVDFKTIVTDMTRYFCLAALRTKEQEIKAKEKEYFDMIQKQAEIKLEEELPDECISVERNY